MPQSSSAPWYITGTPSRASVPRAMKGSTYGESASTALTCGVFHAGQPPAMPITA